MAIGAYEAKTHFSALVKDAAAGVTTVVTKNGKPVAEISPARSDGRERVRDAAERIRRLSDEIHEQTGSALEPDAIRHMRDEGRRYL
ncbi:MAG TPA: type II toxin-antitoxin system prevent-host-death family antitoxin [Candidatus Baltobacteraceae bacterium]|nr:type II toxin-antitoxin system prevent-host-death family antitoxin [Candidatus Baltobacteraceae bacterium]